MPILPPAPSSVPGAQVGERPDGRLRADHRELAVGADDPGAGADLAVLEGRVRTDDRVLADDGGAEQLHAGQDRHVLGQHDVGVDPGGRRVHHRDALLHPAGDDPAVHLGAERGELGAVVGALGLPDVVDRVRADVQPGLARELRRCR